MANTSHRHMPVLGNVHHIKIEYFDILSWRHFSARSSFYILNWKDYPRGAHEKYLKEIVGPVFDKYAIELLGSTSTDEAWRHLRKLHFYREYIDLPGVKSKSKSKLLYWALYNKNANQLFFQ